jgi:hypothetical protein
MRDYKTLQNQDHSHLPLKESKVQRLEKLKIVRGAAHALVICFVADDAITRCLCEKGLSIQLSSFKLRLLEWIFCSAILMGCRERAFKSSYPLLKSACLSGFSVQQLS